MKKSKLLNLIESLNKEEQRRLKEFIKSPYFNKREELVLLYDYIIKLAPNFSTKKLERTYVYAQLFPGKKYDEREITYMMSFLSQLVERYLGQRRYEKDEELLRIHQLESFIKHDLDKHYNYQVKRLGKHFEKQEIISPANYYNLYKLAATKEEYYISIGGQLYNASLQETIDNLDLFYFSRKLQLVCEMEDRNKLVQGTYQYDFVQELLRYIKNSTLIDNYLVKTYYHIINLILLNEPKYHFQQVLEGLDNNFHFLSSKDQENILLHIINFCISEMSKNQDIKYYVAECLKLYLYGLERNLFLKNGVLLQSHFKNIVRLALGLEKYETAEHFIETYSPLLDSEERDNVLNYSLAELNYKQQKYKKALGYLINVVYEKDIYYQLHAKILQTRIYFETEEEEALLSLLASFKLFLRRHKKYGPDKIKSHLNYCNVLSRILRRNIKKKAALKEYLENTELLVGREWLLEALEIAIPD